MDNPHHSWLMDGASLLVIVGACANMLPPIASGIAAVWYAGMVWESRTGQCLRARWSAFRARRLSR